MLSILEQDLEATMKWWKQWIMQPNKAVEKFIAPITAQMDLGSDQTNYEQSKYSSLIETKFPLLTLFFINYEKFIVQYNINPITDDLCQWIQCVDARLQGTTQSSFIITVSLACNMHSLTSEIEKFRQEMVHTLSQQCKPRLKLLVYMQKWKHPKTQLHH